MWFFCILLRDRLHPLTFAFVFSLAMRRDVPWKPVFLWGPCLAWLCQIAAPLRHLITSQTGAGCGGSAENIISLESVWGDESPECLSVCACGSVWSYKGQNVQLVSCPYYHFLSFHQPLYCCTRLMLITTKYSQNSQFCEYFIHLAS